MIEQIKTISNVKTIQKNTMETKPFSCARELRSREARTAYMVLHGSLAQGNTNEKRYNVATKLIKAEQYKIRKIYQEAIKRICFSLAFDHPVGPHKLLERALILGKLLAMFIESEPLVGVEVVPDKINEQITELIAGLPSQEKAHLAAFLVGLTRPLTLSDMEKLVNLKVQ